MASSSKILPKEGPGLHVRTGGSQPGSAICPPLTGNTPFYLRSPTDGGDRLQFSFLEVTFENPCPLGCCAHDPGGEMQRRTRPSWDLAQIPASLHPRPCSLLPCLCQVSVGPCFTGTQLSKATPKPTLPPIGDQSCCSSFAPEMRLQSPHVGGRPWPHSEVLHHPLLPPGQAREGGRREQRG